ncbi:histone deacetylase HDT1 [Syzygium oleosum]|uniref:histone deacetylase HDT1 n=1 Tax=Syzygium oleosum TaxID=219896 RepID=UPI0011D2C762|nr:histone deacetylase HDT1 [Syzygium oleosum]
MEFWGVEVKSGEPLIVEPGHETVVHLSQACLGEAKDKAKESILLYVNIGGQKLVLGTLSADKFPQIPFDLVFEKSFGLSHNWKNGSVFFSGYKTQLPCGSDVDSLYSDSDAEEGLPINVTAQADVPPQKAPVIANANAAKPNLASAKQKVKIAELNEDGKNKGDNEDADSFSDDDEDDSGDEDMVDGGDESSDEDDDDSEEEESSEEEVVRPSKKRPADSVLKTPASDKKSKLETPQKTDGKKASEHVATPYPSKQAGKAIGNKGQAKQQTPNSNEFSCKPCNRSFKSEQAVQSHNKAKHGAS